MSNERIKIFSGLLLLLLVSGCVTHKPFNELPRATEEFKATRADLTNKYPEITVYERRFRFPVTNEPYVKDLVTLWGEPDSVKTRWHVYPLLAVESVAIGVLLDLPWGSMAGIYGGVLALIPGPPQTYLWLKDPYCIEVATQRSIYGLYGRTVQFWKWRDIHDRESLSDDCRTLITRPSTTVRGDAPQHEPGG